MYSQQMHKPQEQYPSAGSNNPWAQTGQPSADTLKPMPTGSNNPFANRTQVQRPATATTGPPSLNTLAEDRITNQFPSSNPNPITNFQPQPQPQSFPAQRPPGPPPQAHDPHHTRLNALLATGDGQDTFGNTGDLRIPAQHTAPGTFVNSAGQGLDRLKATHTGNNPFFGPPPQQPSLTGMPQQPGLGQPSANPWGAQQYQQRQQGGSLIDL